MKKRTIALLMAAVMLFGITVSGTIAWLQATSLEVKNTFTFGEIEIDINETDNEDDDTSTKNNAYDLIPGDVSKKDPKVTVLSGSEKCYVYVKVTEINNTFGTGQDVILYEVDTDKWKLIDSTNSIYVYTNGGDEAYEVDASGGNVDTALILAEVNDISTNQPIENMHIRVNTELTEADITAMETSGTPEISFKACAVQSEHISQIEADEIAISKLITTTTP